MTISGPELIFRIENWARAQRSSTSSGRASSIESEYRNSYHGDTDPDYRGGYSDIDLADAAVVNDAWKRCGPETKDLIKWHYVYRASQAVICRRLKIPHKPAHAFEYAMYNARGEMEKRLEQIEGIVNANQPAYDIAIR